MLIPVLFLFLQNWAYIKHLLLATNMTVTRINITFEATLNSIISAILKPKERR